MTRFVSSAFIALFLLGCQQSPDFDAYVEKSELPIIENQDSLCHGLYLSSDFNNLPPKWAVGKLVSTDENSLTFKGQSRNATIFIRDTNIGEGNYQVGSCYKIDMMNICRSFMMMVDSRYPSPVAGSFVMPEKISC